MVTLSDNEFKKVEYLVGFVNTIAEIVCSPEEYLDFNTKDTTVYAIGYSENQKGNIMFSTLEDNTLADFRENLHSIEGEVRDCVRVDYLPKWEKLRSGTTEDEEVEEVKGIEDLCVSSNDSLTYPWRVEKKVNGKWETIKLFKTELEAQNYRDNLFNTRVEEE